jgi:hypothetical protein
MVSFGDLPEAALYYTHNEAIKTSIGAKIRRRSTKPAVEPNLV